MGDRTQRGKGKTEEVKGRAKRETGVATGDPGPRHAQLVDRPAQ
jgi:uncharacterized protein YjbJ (UPF0337 family)